MRILLFNLLTISILSIIISACSQVTDTAEPALFLILENPEVLVRNDAPIVVPRSELSEYMGSENMAPVLRDSAGQLIPYQLDDLDGDGNWDEMALVVSMAPNSTKPITINWTSPDSIPAFEARTNIRFGMKEGDSPIREVEEYSVAADEIPRNGMPFQMDGPAFENDQIGFRHYFDGRNTRDFFGKRTTEMVLDDVGIGEQGEVKDTYHVLNDWGRDILSVGSSLGLGGISIISNDEAVRLGVTLEDKVNNIKNTTFRLITEGPVRSIFELDFEGWEVGEEPIDLTEHTTIWAGQYWVKNEVTLQGSNGTDTLLVGLVNSNNDEPLMILDDTEEWLALATHDKQTYEKEFYLGMAIILPAENYLGYREAPESGHSITTSYNAMLSLPAGEKLTFYALGGWELNDERFTQRTFFTQFVEKELSRIEEPVHYRIVEE